MAYEQGVLFVTAAGNNGSLDSETGLNRVQIPADMVRGVGAEQGFNKTTVIRRAIDLEAYLDEIRKREGKILVKEKGDDIKEVIFR